KRGTERGDTYPHHEMLQPVSARSEATKQSSLRLASGSEPGVRSLDCFASLAMTIVTIEALRTIFPRHPEV
ncbi:MAG: hypothetical protein IJ127_02630, partial [Afipia sp.]|nr:hypothetical protein [Afipia sp.]